MSQTLPVRPGHPTPPLTSARTPGPPRSRAARALAFPLAWAAIGIVMVALTDSVLVAAGSSLGVVGQTVAALTGGAVALLVHRLVMLHLARRVPTELAAGGAVREVLQGAALGAGFLAVTLGVVTALGGFHVAWHPVDPIRTVVLAVAVSLGAAAVEEVVFRGLAFQAVERMLGRGRGTWVALAVTSLLFGAAHMLNPGATLWSGLAITIEAGVLTGAAFAWRRSLWFVIGVHAAWNAVEGLAGVAVSGHRDPGLLVTTANGPDLLTGGSFGVEGSIVAVLLGALVATPMLVAAARANRRAA